MHISGFENDNEININGPITIAEANLISEIGYSDNLEVSFEYKALYVPNDSYIYNLLAGK